MENLEFTGERLTTGIESIHGVIEHLHRYALAQKITNNKIVLDIASGEGYGSYLLSKGATKVYGVDIDEKSITHARVKYGSTKNIEFIIGSTDAIPIEDNTIDVVVSFETIEHHDKHELMMQEISRVLKKDGYLLISSPEKSIYSERDSNNPFHIKELTLSEFESLLGKHFKSVDLFNQRFVIGSLIHLNNKDLISRFNLFDGNYLNINNELSNDDFYNKPYFNLALCSNFESNNYLEVGSSFFNGVKVVKEELKVVKEEMSLLKMEYEKKYDQISNSESFKLGHKIVKSLKLLRFWKK